MTSRATFHESRTVIQKYDGLYKYDAVVAASYDKDREFEQHWHKEIDYIREYFTGRILNRVLDVPVGTGRFLSCFASAEAIQGVDVSPDMVAQARQRVDALGLNGKCTVTVGDATSLQFPDRTFDATVVVRLIHLLPDAVLPLVVRELCRVSTGVIVVQSYSPTATTVPKEKALSLLGKWAVRIRDEIRNVRQKLLLRKASKAAPESEATVSGSNPWAHIMAYYRPQSEIDALFVKEMWSVESTHVVDNYGSVDVRFTVYTREK